MRRLFREFDKHRFEPRYDGDDPGICNPWWWPRGPGRSAADWGIPDNAREVLGTLMDRAPENARNSSQYCGFLGTVRALPGCPILVSIRPSRGSFQDSFSDGLLPTIAEARCRNGNRALPVHFTDVMKFRQRYGRDSMGPFFDMDDTRWRTSIACLADEFEYLLAQPEQVIVVDLVKACFAKGRNSTATVNCARPGRVTRTTAAG